VDRLGGGALSSGFPWFVVARDSLMVALSDRARESKTSVPSFSPFAQVVERRLAIAQKGLAEARQHLDAGQDVDAGIVLQKIDEDLHLLRRRMSREAETAASRPSPRHGCVH
jgi:hypothetical protein